MRTLGLRLRLVTWAVSSLLLLEGLSFFWSGYAVARIFRGATNVDASAPLPPGVWTDVIVGAVLIALGAAYAADVGRVRQMFLPIAALALVYGGWALWSGYQIMFSLSAALEGDLVALGSLSGIGFLAIGVLGLLGARASTDRTG